MILARLVTPAEFGVVGAALVVLSFVEVISRLGAGPAVVQRPDLMPVHIQVGFLVSIALSGFLALLVATQATYIESIFRMPGLAPIVSVFAVVLPITGAGVIAESLLQREMRFRVLATANVVAFAAGYGLLAMVLAFAGLGVWALVWGHVAQAAIRSAILLYARPHSARLVVAPAAALDLFRFGGGVSLARIGNVLAMQADNFVVGRWLGAEALGMYGRAYQAMMLPVKILGQVSDRVLFPAMSIIQGERARLARAFMRATGGIAMISFPLAALLLVVAPELIQILLGSQWAAVVPLLRVLLVGMVFRTGYKIGDSLARATGAVYRQAWRHWLYATMVFIGAWSGQSWGLHGVCIGVTSAIGVHYLVILHLSANLTGVSIGQIGLMHLRHGAIALAVGWPVWILADHLRTLGVHAALVILCVTAVFATVFAIAFSLRPSVFGQEGIWARDLLMRGIANRASLAATQKAGGQITPDSDSDRPR